MKNINLFSQRDIKNEPLAYRMRPRTLDEYIGQEHIIGKGRLLRRAIQADQLSSLIFYGPPGTGKTTLAKVIANTTKSHFSTINAVLSGVKELREEIKAAKDRVNMYGIRTILFIDEVHRWNKSQQDALLPWVENGTFILIGATTENPFFEVNAALVSRSRIFQLKNLTDKDLYKIGLLAISDKERGYGNYKVTFEEGALEHLVEVAKGDARSLLNALQLAVETSVESFPPKEGTFINITKEVAEESIQQKAVLYDKEGDYHFDVISAFIKSIRGSDPDATLYWLAKMITAGEDPRFIFRRMLISATEDIGLADPNAITVVESNAAAFDRIGLPEGRFHLAHSALYLATAKKSNSTLSIFDAIKAIELEKQQDEVPNHLKDGSRDKEGFGHGEGYLYPHAYKDHFVAQQYLPTSLKGKVFYNPSSQGYEEKIRETVFSKREAQLEATCSDNFVENLTFSPNDRQRDAWIKRTTSERGLLVEKIKDEIYKPLDILRNDRIMILGAGHGLLLWHAFRKTPEGFVCAQVKSKQGYDYINHYASNLDEVTKPFIQLASVKDFLTNLDENLPFEKIIAKNIFSNISQFDFLFDLIKKRFNNNSIFVVSQTIPRAGSRLSDYITDIDTKGCLLKAEEEIYKHSIEGLCGWDKEDLIEKFKKRNFKIREKLIIQKERRRINYADIQRWIDNTYIPALEKIGIDEDSQKLINSISNNLKNNTVNWNHTVLILHISKNKISKEIIDSKKSNLEWQKIHSLTK